MTSSDQISITDIAKTLTALTAIVREMPGQHVLLQRLESALDEALEQIALGNDQVVTRQSAAIADAARLPANDAGDPAP
jgi:hypothetical protein